MIAAVSPRTLYEKLWASHVVKSGGDGSDLLYMDRHLVYEVTSPQAFEGLRSAGRKLWRSQTTYATVDHNVPTIPAERTAVNAIPDAMAREQVAQLLRNGVDFGITTFGLDDRRQGIIHVVGPEQGLTLPGMTVVAGDSHTSTHGAFAALAFGVGTSDVEHVLSTQCLVLPRMKTLLVDARGQWPIGVCAKDLVLYFISRIGAGGATGYAIEFGGEAVHALSMEGRMTLCNMAIEAGARVGLVGVDDTTVAYLKGRPYVPKGAQWVQAQTYWRTLVSDEGATFDQRISIDVASIRPMVTWGTASDTALCIDAVVPDPRDAVDAAHRESMLRALAYMGLQPGTPLTDIMIDKVFIGSCTNARIEDLRIAASVIQGRKVAPSIKLALVVPGSGLVMAQAEAEGLDKLFVDAGFSWREPGCSMCLGMNDDRLSSGERCASTSNRNFEGRQGAGGRTHLVSPAMAVAAAIAGHFVDVSKEFFQ